MAGVLKKKRSREPKPICKYGSSCYRKNPDHRKKFCHTDTVSKKQESHNDSISSISDSMTTSEGEEEHQMPSTSAEIKKDDQADSLSLSSDSSTISESQEEDHIPATSAKNKRKRKEDSPMKDLNENVKKKAATENSSDNSCEPVVPIDVPTLKMKFTDTVENVLKSMPTDFFDFWDFCTSLKKAKPEEAFAGLGLHLVGTYDLMSNNFSPDKVVNLHCHWRYYYDPPEFQTVVKLDGKDLYHIGYFRDDPGELPSILASNSAKLGHKLTLKGDNIFAAMNFEITEAIKNLKDKKLSPKFRDIQDKLKKYASSKKYSLDIQSAKTKARNKKVVAKTFHGLGIVVPLIKDVGYRPLPDSDATVKAVLKKIVSAENEAKRLDEEENLDELITNVQFANDECDYGMGLELGLDLFCYGDPLFHTHILQLLPLAYGLLKRPKYGEIVRAHLQNRKLSDDLSDIYD